MKRHGFILLLILSITLGFFTHSLATVDWDLRNTLPLEESPLDVAVSRSGNWIFVLTDQGNIFVYSLLGILNDKIKIGNHVDQIEAGPIEEILLLKSEKDKTIQILTLEFVKHIDTSGSPFKGPEDAPVVIAVFSEFQ